MTIVEMLSTHTTSITLTIVFILLSLIQVSKIPINPWGFIGKLCKSFMRYLGKIMFEGMSISIEEIKNTVSALDDKVDKLEVKINKVEYENQVDKMKRKRCEILKFYNECYRGIHHSKEEFDNFFETYDEYENIIEEQKLKNGKVNKAYDYVLQIYREVESQHEFIN